MNITFRTKVQEVKNAYHTLSSHKTKRARHPTQHNLLSGNSTHPKPYRRKPMGVKRLLIDCKRRPL
jgi:hypothetical protein